MKTDHSKEDQEEAVVPFPGILRAPEHDCDHDKDFVSKKDDDKIKVSFQIADNLDNTFVYTVDDQDLSDSSNSLEFDPDANDPDGIKAYKRLSIKSKLRSISKDGIGRRKSYRQSTMMPVQHDGWHEASNIWEWERQAQLIVLCQTAPKMFFLPSAFFHFFLKRDWGMALGPLFAFGIYGDARSLDLFLAASLAGVLCGVFKHIFRSPRPFWIVPEVFLKDGVEEMSWATPSAHSAIQGAITAVLLYYDAGSVLNWIINVTILLFVMFSRLYLAVHWPQDVALGAVIGLIAGILVCVSGLHPALIWFARTHHPFGGLLFSAVGIAYNLAILVLVKILSLISDSNPVPDEAIERYTIGVARATRILQSTDELIVDVEENAKRESKVEVKKRSPGKYFRLGQDFNPDTKDRFWYNSMNVLGAYLGLTFYSCIVPPEYVEFTPKVRWIAAIYAAGITYSLICQTRYVLRPMLRRKIFKQVRFFMYAFIGFFTYGLFPLSYLYLMNALAL